MAFAGLSFRDHPVKVVMARGEQVVIAKIRWA
jgi:hypothetical protein